MSDSKETFKNVLSSIKDILGSKDVNHIFFINCKEIVSDLTETETDPLLWFNNNTLEKIMEISMEYISTLNIFNVILYGVNDYYEVVETLVQNLVLSTDSIAPKQYVNLATTNVGEINDLLKNNRTLTTMMLLYLVFKSHSFTQTNDTQHPN